MAEIGVDMSVFADAQHLSSCAGLCPGNRERGGKRISGRVRKANRYIKRALCQAAWAASHAKNTYLSAFSRRMRVREGHQGSHVLGASPGSDRLPDPEPGEECVEMGGDYYDHRNKPKVPTRLLQRLTRLGYRPSALRN